ncbi:MAG: DUF11 domain-containing protein [Candidatus Verstraetearchaeota archaeon]|nr:DUF11 domain-containing protein [Candidatus Verstraetearchaeota archaeon]
MRFKNRFLVYPVILLFILVVNGVAYSHWNDRINIKGKMVTGEWRVCIKIRKSLEGSFTDPWTGEDLSTPTDLIAIASLNFTTKFKLTIYVKNCGSKVLTDVFVRDRIQLNLAPLNSTPSKGSVSWREWKPHGRPGEFAFNYLTWIIGRLNPGEEATLVIWIGTLRNPRGKYEPTSGDDCCCMCWQCLEINRGAMVTATSPYGILFAVTGRINIRIVDDGTPGNGIGRIATTLPYVTCWAVDENPS